MSAITLTPAAARRAEFAEIMATVEATKAALAAELAAVPASKARDTQAIVAEAFHRYEVAVGAIRLHIARG